MQTCSISIFGLGYVGSVTAACLAHLGHQVTGVDVNADKVRMLDSGRSPVVEDRLDELVTEAHQAGRLHATTDAAAAVLGSDVSFACVGTPSQRNGKLDLAHIVQVCCELGRGLARKNSFHTIVLRSTVLPGTVQSVVIPALEKCSRKRAGVDFAVCYNPEFMREGTAVADFFAPPFTIFGANDPAHLVTLRQVYEPIAGKKFETSLSVAEMAKYVSNAFHALKVAFANEVGTLARQLSVDTEELIHIFTSDTKLNISSAYLTPGFAFGGSCLPKDLRALEYCAMEFDLELPLLESILPSNTQHIERALDAIFRTDKKKVALLGLSFKAGTDDLRESPQVQLAKRLIGEGYNLRIWDPCVSLGQLVGSNRQFINQVIPHIGCLLSTDLLEVVRDAEIVVVGTKSIKLTELMPVLREDQIVIDLVNLNALKHLEGTNNYRGLCW
jgi:GDP-mannose 6-dehydrogenase